MSTIVLILTGLIVWSGSSPACGSPALNGADSEPEESSVGQRGPLPGQIIADPANPRWLKIQGGGPFFLCGAGDPENFLYRGQRNADGTRTGDQCNIIHQLEGTAANSVYLMALRSHGDDGDGTQNPLVDSDPAKGLDRNILAQWERWFTEMDDHGIVIFFFSYDDNARIWNTGDVVAGSERDFLRAIINGFKHHRHLIWAIAEEYQEAYTARRVSNIAADIRAADEHRHVIAVHKLDGLDFSESADDSNIDQFAIQSNPPTTAAAKRGIGRGAAGGTARGSSKAVSRHDGKKPDRRG